jgi:hypothetical protein
MTRLGAIISEAIVHHYGRDELLRRLANPFWFQSFGAVRRMDWHSSVIGALKRGRTSLGERARRSRLRRAREAPTVRALVMVAEIVHGPSYRFTDPARFSLAHGGKDRHPFPVPLRVYDETISVLKSAVSNARLGREEELRALKRFDEQARLLKHHASGHPVDELIAVERERPLHAQ